MPEGDALHRAAERVSALAGQVVAVETPHPRAAALRLAERLDGKRLEGVEAVGKNLLLAFEGGLVLRSHLRMNGRWQVRPVGSRRVGTPWLVLRGSELEAVQWNGPVLELGTAARPRAVARLGPDIMAGRPDLASMLGRLRREDPGRQVGDALLDQRLVAGIGNKWKAEALHAAQVSPWLALRDVADPELDEVLSAAARLMQDPPRRREVYRRAGLPCRRCGTTIRSWPQGDAARMAYWCPGCQAGTEPAGA
jgi:endonuclease-8